MNRIFKPGALQLTGSDLTAALRGMFVCSTRFHQGKTTRTILFEDCYYECNDFEWACLKNGATPEELGMYRFQYGEEPE